MAVQVQYHPDSSLLCAIRGIDRECFPDEPMDEHTLASAIQEDFWIALCDGLPAGFVYLIRRPDVSWLSRIGTASSHRCRGVATALLQTVLRHCAQIGLPETILYVRTDNPHAMRLYERFGFASAESSYQFVLTDPLARPASGIEDHISAVPIDTLPASDLPSFRREWANITTMHRPPDTYVLVFREGDRTVGYTRLNPGFPGCFPFVVEEPLRRLRAVLRVLVPYLRPDKEILKLTFWDSAMAEACRRAGLRLNYELVKMHRKG